MLAQVAVKPQHLGFFMIIIIMNSIHVYLGGDHGAGDSDDRLEGDANLGGDAHLDVDGDGHLGGDGHLDGDGDGHLGGDGHLDGDAHLGGDVHLMGIMTPTCP